MEYLGFSWTPQKMQTCDFGLKELVILYQIRQYTSFNRFPSRPNFSIEWYCHCSTNTSKKSSNWPRKHLTWTVQPIRHPSTSDWGTLVVKEILYQMKCWSLISMLQSCFHHVLCMHGSVTCMLSVLLLPFMLHENMHIWVHVACWLVHACITHLWILNNDY